MGNHNETMRIAVLELEVMRLNSIINAEPIKPIEWTAERIAKLLLGGDTELDCYAVNIDGTLVFPTECSEGYEDRDEPVISAYNDTDEEPFMELTLNELDEAVVHEESFTVQSNATGEVFVIYPLTRMKLK